MQKELALDHTALW